MWNKSQYVYDMDEKDYKHYLIPPSSGEVVQHKGL